MGKVGIHYALGIVLGLLVFAITYLLMLIPGVGYEIFAVQFAVILFAQCAFYAITAAHGRAWSIVGLVVNLVLWVTELVQLEHFLEGSSAGQFLYHNDDYFALRFVLGGIFWATNKLVIDVSLGQFIHRRKGHVAPLDL
jgi:hypothetical protein